MRLSLFQIVALFLLVGLMLWHPHAAQAHEFDNDGYTVTHQSGDPSPTEAKATDTQVFASASQHENNCHGACCSMGGLCCASGALPAAAQDFAFKSAKFDFAFPKQSLPQGPPFSLLRPPKFSA